MTVTIYLPFDILAAIFEKVDNVRDIWHLRTANRAFCAAATPIAFRKLSVITTKRSAQNLGRLFDVPDIADHVRQVTFHDTDPDRRGMAIKYGAFFPEGLRWQLVKSDLTSAVRKLASSFSRVHQLPRLETINLTFYPRYGNRRHTNQSDRSTLTLQSSILGALSSSFSVRVPNLTTLSLHNLRISDLSPLESPAFQTVLTTLRHLKLSPIRDPPGQFAVDDSWIHSWGALCSRMLTPMQHSLTELTLHNDADVDALSGVSFAALRFPRLCALSLKRLVFEPSEGAQNFILRHAATLVRLELLMCKLPTHPIISFIPYAPLFLSLRVDTWERIWDCFAAKLTALLSLRVDESRGEWGEEFRYGLQDISIPANRDPCAFARRDTADAAALRRLHMIVAARSEEPITVAPEKPHKPAVNLATLGRLTHPLCFFCAMRAPTRHVENPSVYLQAIFTRDPVVFAATICVGALSYPGALPLTPTSHPGPPFWLPLAVGCFCNLSDSPRNLTPATTEKFGAEKKLRRMAMIWGRRADGVGPSSAIGKSGRIMEAEESIAMCKSWTGGAVWEQRKRKPLGSDDDKGIAMSIITITALPGPNE
ncbi:hypothetical protein EDB84DRAFT_1678374 [Lactarius hengduanensis]|nr:hypothetical protein EDB84DRAFT_1678374 [Lactarius hengduanensis]